MSDSQSHDLLPLLRKFELRAPLDDGDREAFLGLPHRVQVVENNIYLVREGDRPDRSCVLIEGYAYRHKMTESGARQIVSVHMAGDFLDLDGALLNIADHNIQTMTRCRVAMIPRAAVRDLIVAHPRIGMAMWVDTLIDGSIFREWVVNVGRRDARARIAHLLCEFARRLEVAGLAQSVGYVLPMTQETLADATGLTTVHVSRVLKSLAADGLIRRTRRAITIPDWQRLRDVAMFSETYLHLDQVARGHRPDRNL